MRRGTGSRFNWSDMPLRWKISVGLCVLLIVLPIASWTFVGSSPKSAAFEAGLCYDMTGAETLADARATGCGSPHTREIFAGFEAEVFGEFDAESVCRSLADASISSDLLPDDASFGLIAPNREQWDAGDRGVLCSVEFATPVDFSVLSP